MALFTVNATATATGVATLLKKAKINFSAIASGIAALSTRLLPAALRIKAGVLGLFGGPGRWPGR